MASGQTENFGLSQWAAEDQVIRTEFNEDNAKIDAVLAEISSALSKIVTGTYTGNGTDSRTISLGFAPKAVYVCHQSGKLYDGNGNYYFGGLALKGHPAKPEGGPATVELVSGGFKVNYSMSNTKARIMTNAAGYVFHYLALE